VELDVRYVRNAGVAIAYQVVGDADTDLVLVPDYVSAGTQGRRCRRAC
jgi:hypothetical protein